MSQRNEALKIFFLQGQAGRECKGLESPHPYPVGNLIIRMWTASQNGSPWVIGCYKQEQPVYNSKELSSANVLN